MAPVCTPTAGTGTCICSPTACKCTPFDTANLAYAGASSDGTPIYMNDNGSLVYPDGSPATRDDINCTQGACAGTPCGPKTCGTTDQAPHGSQCSGKAGGGSGGGSAKSAGGQPRTTPKNCQATLLSKAMNNFGSTIAALLAGGTSSSGPKAAPKVTNAGLTCISSNSFLLIIIIIGALLLFMAFGHKPERD